MTFYSSSLEENDSPPHGSSVVIDGLEKPAIVHAGGMTLIGKDGKLVGLQTKNIQLVFTVVFLSKS